MPESAVAPSIRSAIRVEVVPVIGGVYREVMARKTVAGESADVLLKAFLQFNWRKRAGMVEVSATLERELGGPLLRAVETIEQELLDDDVARRAVHTRTPAERRADAFVLLFDRLSEALGNSQKLGTR